MKIVAATNTFIAVALNEPEKDMIIRLTEGYDLIAPEVLPFEIGNALTAMMKKKRIRGRRGHFRVEYGSAYSSRLSADRYQSGFKYSNSLQHICMRFLFLECALNLRSPLLTLDRRMNGIAHKIGIQVMEQIL